MSKQIAAFRAEVENSTEYWVQRAISAASLDLKRLLVKRGLSRAQLAERLGKSKAYISKVFNEDANFTVSTLVSLARAMDGHVEIRIVPAEMRRAAQVDAQRGRVHAYAVQSNTISLSLKPQIARATHHVVAANVVKASSNDNRYDVAA